MMDKTLIDTHDLEEHYANLNWRNVNQSIDDMVENTEILTLSYRDQEKFANTLLNPTPPNAALNMALQRHTELFGV